MEQNEILQENIQNSDSEQEITDGQDENESTGGQILSCIIKQRGKGSKIFQFSLFLKFIANRKVSVPISVVDEQ